MKQVVRAYGKKAFLLGSDLFLVLLSLPCALFLRLEGTGAEPMFANLTVQHFIVAFSCYLMAFIALRTYRTIISLANLSTALRITAAICFGACAYYLTAVHVLQLPVIPRSTYVIQLLILVPSCLFVRFSRRIVNRLARGKRDGVRTLIYGAGLTTDRLVPLLLESDKSLNIVGLIDDDRAKRGSDVQGIRVRGGLAEISEIINRYRVELVILSMPTASGEKIRTIIDALENCNVRVKTIPVPADYFAAMDHAKVDLRDLNIEDLLRRSPRTINKEAIAALLQGKEILVTGGGGSIGSELVRQVARMKPRKLIVNDASELALYRISEEISENYSEINFVAHLGDLSNSVIAESLFTSHSIQLVFHASAYKHVPLVESNPCAGILNNLGSALNVFECARKYGVRRVVLISSDKAVHPTNVMGATKRAAELLAQWYAHEYPQCVFSAVRFGNVLGSSGSVVPKFIEQIRAGGPITITHPDITRYFMLIPEAVALVLQASTTSRSGEIYLLNMGEPIKIADMAADIIRLAGKKPGRDIAIEYTGLRPGEKLYEELSLHTESVTSISEDVFRLESVFDKKDTLITEMNKLLNVSRKGDALAARTSLFEMICQPTADTNLNLPFSDSAARNSLCIEKVVALRPIPQQ